MGARISFLIFIIAGLQGCATPAPAMTVCAPDWVGQTLYCSNPQGASVLPMKSAPRMFCEPAADFDAYVKYTRSKE